MFPLGSRRVPIKNCGSREELLQLMSVILWSVACHVLSPFFGVQVSSVYWCCKDRTYGARTHKLLHDLANAVSTTGPTVHTLRTQCCIHH